MPSQRPTTRVDGQSWQRLYRDAQEVLGRAARPGDDVALILTYRL
jgi:hypothetical protein